MSHQLGLNSLVSSLTGETSSALSWMSKLIALLRTSLLSNLSVFGTASGLDRGFVEGNIPWLGSRGKIPNNLLDTEDISGSENINVVDTYRGTEGFLTDFNLEGISSGNSILLFSSTNRLLILNVRITSRLNEARTRYTYRANVIDASGGAVTYQWQFRRTPTGDWANLTGSVSRAATYTPIGIGFIQYWEFRVIVTFTTYNETRTSNVLRQGRSPGTPPPPVSPVSPVSPTTPGSGPSTAQQVVR